jgi:hypothetical protein
MHWVGKRVVVWRRSWEFIAAQTQSCGFSAKLGLLNIPVMSKFSGWMIGPGAAAIAMGQSWWTWNDADPSIFFPIANPTHWRNGSGLIPASK